jgi:hypothetical protein
VPADLRLPQVMFWAQAPALAPRPQAKKFILPGRVSQQARQAELTAPPRLEAPNVEMRITDLKVAGAQLPKPNPALPVPAGTPMPVRNQSETVQRTDAPPAVNAAQGEAVNVLALNPNPAPFSYTLVVPPGSQISAQHASSGQGESGDGSGSKSGESGKGTGQAKEGAGTGEGSGPGKGAGAGSGGTAGSGAGFGGEGGFGSGGSRGGTGAGGSGSSGSGSGSGSGSANGSGSGSGSGSGGGSGSGCGGTGAGGRAIAAQPPASMKVPETGVPIRLVHPDNGVFDIVVQSASADQVAQASGVLTGRPVYTEYIRVGAPKDWVLHYCIPTYPARNTGPVVQLGSPSPLKAPFPRLTMIPRPEEFVSKSRAFLHGFLTESGQFRALGAIRAEDAEMVAQLIPYLEKWEFRPATRDGKPVEVELLLVVPAAGS